MEKKEVFSRALYKLNTLSCQALKKKKNVYIYISLIFYHHFINSAHQNELSRPLDYPLEACWER
jgi:hypothetical protein